MPETTPIHLSVRDACARHNLSRSALYILIGQGKIAAVKNGRRTLIVTRTLDDHFAALPPAKIKAPAAPAPDRASASVSDTAAPSF
jgi:excisionase family DNA binding protein